MGFSELPTGPLVEAMDKTVLKYSDLDSLLQSEPEARQYYDALPDYVREQISTRTTGVNSLASLKDYAENLTRGDD